jgi:1-acyl-sn-glycerol-3-phosphate acyltransferase
VGERAGSIAAPDFSDRRNVFFFIAKSLTLLGHRFLARPHIEMDSELIPLRQGGRAVFVYCGLHKSLWETTGVLAPVYLSGLPVPYVGMGDNLVKGRVFQAMSKRIGTFLVRRPTNRREMAESARKLRDDVLGFVARGLDVLVFPEGTRKNIPNLGHYGDFFPAAFDAVLDYERRKPAILEANPQLAPRDVYLVPFNVDYSRVREAREMVDEHSGTPRTLHVFDSFAMIRNIGETYLSYGPPVRVADHLDVDRKALAAFCRQRCLDLVKILPINVASRAILTLPEAPSVPRNALNEAILRVVDGLRPFADRFRGLAAVDPPEEVARRAAQAQLDFRGLGPDDAKLYRLYASYISHYLDVAPAPAH